MCVLVVPVVLKLTPELAGILLSPEEFDTIEDCDELYNYELVHGVLVVAPPPDIGEREPNEQLGHLLRSYKDQHPQGAALNLTVSEHSIRTPDSRRRADRVIWTGLGRIPDTRRDQPTIAIEFVSASRRDFLRDYVLVFYQFEWHSAADFGDAKWYAKTNSRTARPDHRPSVSDSRSN
jgi:Uma2 family endonuclease